jgi:hypothetical protein
MKITISSRWSGAKIFSLEGGEAKSIADMDSRAAEFWRDWKAPLLAMCSVHAA